MTHDLSFRGGPGPRRADRDARGARRRGAPAARPGVGRPGRPRAPAHSRLVAEPALLDPADRGRPRPEVPHRHVRQSGPRDVREAPGGGPLPRSPAVGGRRGGGDRPRGPGAPAAGRLVLRRVHRDRLRPRVRRAGDRRPQPRRGCRRAGASGVRPHRPRLPRERPRRRRARPGHEHRRRPAVPRGVHRRAPERGGLERGAVLDHGRPRRGEGRPDLAGDQSRRRPGRPDHPRPGDPRPRRRDRAPLDGRARPGGLRHRGGVVVRGRRTRSRSSRTRSRFDRELGEFAARAG